MLKFNAVIALLTLPIFTFANTTNDCGNSEQAVALAKLIQKDKQQGRANIRCNQILTQAAESKARQMLEFGLVAHNLGGSPNSHLRNANYKLPEYYGRDFDSNQVEAIAGGYPNANIVWQALKRSKAHRAHLLGEHEFYLEQDEIGVAFIREWQSPHVEYWVVYLTKGYEKNQSATGGFSDIPNKGMFILQQPNGQEGSVEE